ncbi:MAG: sensor histidine kinase [Firmicutes bacterium]|nr:sensor histidine kinase [Bacillota bacterium]
MRKKAGKTLLLREITRYLLVGLVTLGVVVLVLLGANGGWTAGTEVWLLSPSGLMAVVLAGAAAAVISAVLMATASLRGLMKDLDDLRHGARMLTEGNLHWRWGRWGYDARTDELREQLNAMAQRWQEQTLRLRRLADEKEELAAKAQEVGMMAERQRLARELHDAVSQQLFALAMTAAATQRLLAQDPERAREGVAHIEKLAQQAQREMRALLLHLRPVELTDESLPQAIQSVLAELEGRGLIRCQIKGDWELDLTPAAENNLLRIFQEAVANTLRHAQASNLSVSLSQDESVIRMVISDDGVGFDLEEIEQRPMSYGLTSMQERARECGGRVKVVTMPGRGTRIDVQIPRV